MVRARSGSWGSALLTGESRLGAGAGELAQRELDHGQQRLWRVGAKPAPHGDPCRRGDRSGENLRPISAPGSAPVRSAIAAASASCISASIFRYSPRIAGELTTSLIALIDSGSSACRASW